MAEPPVPVQVDQADRFRGFQGVTVQPHPGECGGGVLPQRVVAGREHRTAVREAVGSTSSPPATDRATASPTGSGRASRPEARSSLHHRFRWARWPPWAQVLGLRRQRANAVQRQRVAASGPQHRVPYQRIAQVGHRLGQQRGAGVRVQRLQAQHRHRGEFGWQLADVRCADHEHEADPRVAEPPRGERQRGKRLLVGPVGVVHDDQQRFALRCPAEQVQDAGPHHKRGRRDGARGSGPPSASTWASAGAVGAAGWRAGPATAAGRLQGAVGEVDVPLGRARAQHRGAGGRRPGILDQPGLPESGAAGDDDRGHRAAGSSGERSDEPFPLDCPPPVDRPY